MIPPLHSPIITKNDTYPQQTAPLHRGTNSSPFTKLINTLVAKIKKFFHTKFTTFGGLTVTTIPSIIESKEKLKMKFFNQKQKMEQFRAFRV
jgi:hypothetical protein